jgi:ADP-heptose:LPS heptosyltransferase
MRSRKNRRILVIVRGHVGDLVQATPALRALREHFPEAHIAAMVNEYAMAVLDGCPYVDQVIAGFAYDRRSRLQRLGDGARLFRTLVGRFDTVVGLRYSPRPWPALALAIGARTRVGFDQPRPWGRLLTHNAGRPQPDDPNRIRNLLPLRQLGVDGTPDYEPLTWAGAETRSAVDKLLSSVDVAGETPFAVLQTSVNWGCNELRSDKWAAVADTLATAHGLRTVAIGVDDPFERAKYDEIRARAAHPPASLHGRTTLPELFEVVRRASLVVATDSSLTQIALAQEVPAVIMFGIEPPVHNGPLPEERSLMEVIQHWDGPELAPTPNPHCRFYESSCHTEFCCENSSLAQTTVVEIMERAATAMARNAAASVSPQTSNAEPGGDMNRPQPS